MSENSERAKQRRIAARELNWHEGKLPRKDREYRKLLRAATRAYDKWLADELAARQRKRPNITVQRRKSAA